MTLRRLLAAAPAALLLALAAAPAAADSLQLKDGRVVQGIRMERQDDALLLHFRNGDVRVPLSMVDEYLIEGAPAPEPATEEERAKRAQGLVPWRGRWVPAAERDRAQKKEAAERKKAIEEYAKHSQWKDRYQFKTTNFEFQSTLPEDVNDRYSGLLETYFKEFGRIWRTHLPNGWGRLTVCFYKDYDEFLRTTGVPRGVLAYYRFADPRELNFFYERGDEESCTATLFHEANHYLTHLLNPKFRFPHWVNEAMAEYYGASVWDPAKKTMVLGGVQQGRLAEVRVDIATGKRLELRDLLADDSGAYEHYYWGWSLVHFLMESPKHRTKFMKFFADLATAPDVERRPSGLQGFSEIRGGKEILRVFLTRMGLKEADLDDLQKQWYAHIDGLDTSAVKGLEEGGIQALRTGQWKFRAPRLLEEAIAKGSTNTQAYLAYARCMFLKRDPESLGKASSALEKATAFDPLNGDLRAAMSLAATLSGRKDDGAKLLELAKELNPDNDYISVDVQIKLADTEPSGGE